MRTRTRYLVVAAAALFAAQARAQDDKEKLDESIKFSTTLTEVTSFPEAYRRIPFDLDLLYHGPREVYNPYHTLFEPSSYLNFAAWSADQPIWNRDTYVNDYPMFYVERKNSSLEHAIIAMKPFTWFTAHCIVRSAAQGHAWIEVLSIVRTESTLDGADLRHLVRGSAWATTGEYDRSLLEFGLAKLYGAPTKFVGRCHADQGRVALSAGQANRAMAELSAALAVLPEDKEIVALLDRASNNVSLDRVGQVASAPTTVPPPLSLKGEVTVPKPPPPPAPVDPKAAAAKPGDAKTDAKSTAAAPKTAPAADAKATSTDAPKSSTGSAAPKSDTKSDAKSDTSKASAPKADAAKSSTAKSSATKSDSTKSTAAQPKPAAPKSDDATKPAAEPTPAAKPEPVAAPKSDENPAPKSEEPTTGDSTKEPAPATDGDKPEVVKEVPDAPNPDANPAPDAPQPEEKKDENPAPAEPKDGDKPEEKKEGEPAPDAPKPEEKPVEKPADPPAEKPADKPATKPAAKPATKPAAKPADAPKTGGN